MAFGYGGGFSEGFIGGTNAGTRMQQVQVQREALMREKMNDLINRTLEQGKAIAETTAKFVQSQPNRNTPQFGSVIEGFQGHIGELSSGLRGLGPQGSQAASTLDALFSGAVKSPTVSEAATAEATGDVTKNTSVASQLNATPGAVPPGHTVTASEAAGITKPTGTQLDFEYGQAGGQGGTDTKNQFFWETELAKPAIKKLEKEQESAVAAREAINTSHSALELLDKDAITGFAADYKVAFGKAMNQVPVLGDLAQALGVTPSDDAIANTEAFSASMARQVKANIKAFGSGVSISDADREFTEKMVGGRISLTKDSIKRIIRLNDEVNAQIIDRYNNNLARYPENPVFQPVETPAVTNKAKKGGVGTTSTGIQWSVE